MQATQSCNKSYKCHCVITRNTLSCVRLVPMSRVQLWEELLRGERVQMPRGRSREMRGGEKVKGIEATDEPSEKGLEGGKMNGGRVRGGGRRDMVSVRVEGLRWQVQRQRALNECRQWILTWSELLPNQCAMLSKARASANATARMCQVVWKDVMLSLLHRAEEGGGRGGGLGRGRHGRWWMILGKCAMPRSLPQQQSSAAASLHL